MPTPPFEEISITPALFAIIKAGHVSDIREKWTEHIYPVLLYEATIYKAAFYCYAILEDLGSVGNDDEESKDYFLQTLRMTEKRLLSVPDEIIKCLYTIYWNMAKAENSGYWILGRYLQMIGGTIAYEDAKTVWRTTNANDFEWSQRRLKQWLNTS